MLMRPWMWNDGFHEISDFCSLFLTTVTLHLLVPSENDINMASKPVKPALVTVRMRKNKGLFTLDPVLLQLLDFSDGLSQVADEFLTVLRVGSIEIDQDFEVSARNGWSQTDTMWIDWESKILWFIKLLWKKINKLYIYLYSLGVP